MLPNTVGCDFKSSYDPENLTAYALGTKNRFFENSVQFNLEAYFWKYSNLQVSRLGIINPGINALRVDNVGEAVIKGVEADLNWLVLRNGTFSAAIDIKDSQYGVFRYANLVAGRTTIIDNTGRSFLGTPRFTTTLSYLQRIPLDNGASIEAQVRSRYSSKVVFAYATPPGLTNDVVQRPVWVSDVDLTYRAPGGRWRLTGYVRNVENKAVVALAGNSSPSTGTPWALVAPPRTAGVIVTANWN